MIEIIKSGENIYRIGEPNDVAGIDIIFREYDSSWGTSALKVLPKEKYSHWNCTELKIGDIIEVEFGEFEKGSMTLEEIYSAEEEIKKNIYFNETNFWKCKLNISYIRGSLETGKTYIGEIPAKIRLLFLSSSLVFGLLRYDFHVPSPTDSLFMHLSITL